MSRILIKEHGGQVPHDREALETLPGVGRKTANVVLNVAFGEPTMAVDTHIFRVANRTGLAPGKTPLDVEKALLATIPERFLLHAHHWLILHGRYVCKARKPECPRCQIADLCRYDGENGITEPCFIRGTVSVFFYISKLVWAILQPSNTLGVIFFCRIHLSFY